MPIKNVVLVGATGTNGRAIYTALVASPAQFNITFLTRPESKAQFPSGHKVLRYSYDDPSLVDALRDQDAIVSAISGMAIPAQIPLINAAIKAGVRKFMPSEYSSDTLNPAVHKNLQWYGQMKDVHDHLVRVSAANPHFSYCALMTGPLFDFGLQSGMFGFDLKEHKATILDGGELQISSVTCSQNQLLTAIEKVTGVKWERKEETTQHYMEMSEEMMKSDDRTGQTQMHGAILRILRIAYGADTEPGWGEGDNDKLGLEESKLEDLVKEALGKE